MAECTKVESVCRKLGASVPSREMGVKLERQLTREGSSRTFNDSLRLKIQDRTDGS